MKQLLLLTLLGCSIALGSVFAADLAPKTVAVAKVAAGNVKTKNLNPKGRYHTLHAQKLKLDCTDCHGDGAADVLFLRTGEFQGKDGPVNREVCLGCHKAPKQPAWYGAAK